MQSAISLVTSLHHSLIGILSHLCVLGQNQLQTGYLQQVSQHEVWVEERQEQLHAVSYLHKCIIVGDLTVVTIQIIHTWCSYTNITNRRGKKKYWKFKRSNPVSASRCSQLSHLSLQLRMFSCLSAALATAEPLHGCKSNKTSNELQMYCQTTPTGSVTTCDVKWSCTAKIPYPANLKSLFSLCQYSDINSRSMQKMTLKKKNIQ